MKIILFTLGTAGDVNPVLALGKYLKQKEYSVTVIANSMHESKTTRLGLSFVSGEGDRKLEEFSETPEFWHPTKSVKTLRDYLLSTLDAGYQALEKEYVAGETILVGSTLGFTSGLFSEKYNIPMTGLHLSPCCIPSPYNRFSFPKIIDSIPGAKGPTYKAMNWYYDSLYRHEIESFRRKIGLAKMNQNFYQQWLHIPEKTICLWPQWFGKGEKDWPKEVHFTGFLDYDGVEKKTEEIPSLKILKKEPHILFTPGSAVQHAKHLFGQAVQACRQFKNPVAFVTPYKEQLPSELPSNVKHMDFVPFKEAFPLCSVVVHHGGVGTSARALTAGVPQLVIPMAHDQFDNAYRLEAMGVAKVLLPRQIHHKSLRKNLQHLLESSPVKEKCQHYAKQFDSQESVLEKTVDLILS